MSIEGVRFLQQVREAVAGGNHFASAPPLDPRGAVGYQGAGADPVLRFRDEFAAAGGFTHAVADAVSAAKVVLALLQERSVRRVLLGTGAVLDSLDLSKPLKSAGLEISLASSGGAESRDDSFAADAGISGVDYLIAETGSLIVLSRPEQPRSLSLLPPLHIAIAHRDQILLDLFDLFESGLWADRGGLPSCLSLITGPSKTGDIELRLVTGVHGPGEVHVVLIGALAPSVRHLADRPGDG